MAHEIEIKFTNKPFSDSIKPLTLADIIYWLKENNATKLEKLWDMADNVRSDNVGQAVHLRGLIEISNFCVRKCGYCGISVLNKDVPRYRMSRDEIMKCAQKAVEFGYGTVVMQAGEDYGLKTEWLADIIREIKKTTPLAVTLSLGERPMEDLIAWRKAGADRYLIRFETANEELYKIIHPPKNDQETLDNRFKILAKLRDLGYEIGSGVMIGIPSQTYEDLAHDILKFGELDLDMIGVGPYIEHLKTPLGSNKIARTIDSNEQVPNSELMTYKVVALTRLICPQANIPSTTALATINKDSGREFGLMRGANVVMPNLTPPKYRVQYEIYPGKACINETADQCQKCMRGRILSIGREVGEGMGNRVN